MSSNEFSPTCEVLYFLLPTKLSLALAVVSLIRHYHDFAFSCFKIILKNKYSTCTVIRTTAQESRELVAMSLTKSNDKLHI